MNRFLLTFHQMLPWASLGRSTLASPRLLITTWQRARRIRTSSMLEYMIGTWEIQQAVAREGILVLARVSGNKHTCYRES